MIKGGDTYVHVPLFWCMYVEEMARSSSPFRSLRVRDTGIGCLCFDGLIRDTTSIQV